MKEETITLKTAKLAKEKGFDVACDNAYFETIEHTVDDPRSGTGEFTFSYQPPRILQNRYNGGDTYTKKVCEAPTQSLVQKWLREVHNLHVTTVSSRDGTWGYWIYTLKNYGEITSPSLEDEVFSSYENAIEGGLREALKIIK